MRFLDIINRIARDWNLRKLFEDADELQRIERLRELHREEHDEAEWFYGQLNKERDE